MNERDVILDGLVEIVPDELRRTIRRPDVCVLATKIGYDACRYFGIDAKPVTARTIAFNQRWFEFTRDSDFFASAETGETLAPVDADAWEQALVEDAWSIAIDETVNEPGRYAGHLVLLADETMLDLSARQFSRPDHGMAIPDAIRLDFTGDEFDRGLMFCNGTNPPAYVAYLRRYDAPDYRRGADWRLKNDITGKVIRRLKMRCAPVPSVGGGGRARNASQERTSA